MPSRFLRYYLISFHIARSLDFNLRADGFQVDPYNPSFQWQQFLDNGSKITFWPMKYFLLLGSLYIFLLPLLAVVTRCSFLLFTENMLHIGKRVLVPAENVKKLWYFYHSRMFRIKHCQWWTGSPDRQRPLCTTVKGTTPKVSGYYKMLKLVTNVYSGKIFALWTQEDYTLAKERNVGYETMGLIEKSELHRKILPKYKASIYPILKQ